MVQPTEGRNENNRSSGCPRRVILVGDLARILSLARKFSTEDSTQIVTELTSDTVTTAVNRVQETE